MALSRATSATPRPRRNASPTYQSRSAFGTRSRSRTSAWLEAEAPDLERAERLLERLLEGPPDRHHLADRLHLRAERVARLGELLEGEARDLGHHVVDRRLEAGGRLARDVVAELVERVADGELGGDLRDREARGLRGERRAAR